MDDHRSSVTPSAHHVGRAALMLGSGPGITLVLFLATLYIVSTLLTKTATANEAGGIGYADAVLLAVGIPLSIILGFLTSFVASFFAHPLRNTVVAATLIGLSLFWILVLIVLSFGA